MHSLQRLENAPGDHKAQRQQSTGAPRVVLHVCSGDLWGGAEALVRDLVVAQARERRVMPHCVVLNDGELARSLRMAAVPVLQMDESRAGFVELLRNTIAYCREVRPAIIHSHRVKEHVLAGLTSLVLRLSGSPVTAVGTVHGGTEVLRSDRRARHTLVRIAERLALSVLLRRVALVSEDLERAIGRSLWPARCTVVHNGIDVRRIKHAAANPSAVKAGEQREILLVAAGRLVPVKRFDRLPQIGAALHRASARPVRIVLLGDGPLREELRSGFESQPQPGVAIEMRGFVENVAAVVRTSDGLLIPSDHEGLPMAALEAVALGIPVFCFRTGGLPEVMERGAAGCMAPLGDCAALGEAIAQHLGAWARRETLGTLLPAEQAWYFSIDACRARYHEFYEAALGSRQIETQ